ncbi:MAG: hypothetical protein WCC01_02705 [Acidimicrobiia bacterium]
MPRSVRRILLIAAAFALFVVPAAAIAAAGFTDVADDSVFVADIQWMKDNAITAGCNPPANDRYCPGNNVTREQMSAFMRRLATYQVVDAATAIEAENADELDGRDGNEYRTIVAGDGCYLGDCDDSDAFTLTRVAKVTLDAPIAGVFDIDYSWAGSNAAVADNYVQTWVAVDQSETTGSGCGGWFFAPTDAVTGTYGQTSLYGTVDAGTTAGSSVVEVSAGTHTISVCTLGGQALITDNAGLSVVWSAEGSGMSLASAGQIGDIDHLRAVFGEDAPHLGG